VREERGAATVEWTGIVVVVAIALGSLGLVAPTVDGRSLGAAISHALVCAVEGGCDDGDDELVAAYGERDAELVRRHAPSIVYERGELQLPVDYRDCRSPECAEAPDDPDLDAHRTTDGNHPATAFTHLVRKGGETFIQYHLYYPDSNTTALGSDRAFEAAGPVVRLASRALTGSWDYPGYHADDWEHYQVRIDPAGAATARASSHHNYQWCKQLRCRNTWGPPTGWTRVSKGSHAGHIPLRSDLERVELSLGAPLSSLRLQHSYAPLYPGPDLRERTTTAPGLRLVPIERLDTEDYRPLDPEIAPPWEKDVYENPLSEETGRAPTR